MGTLQAQPGAGQSPNLVEAVPGGQRGWGGGLGGLGAPLEAFPTPQMAEAGGGLRLRHGACACDRDGLRWDLGEGLALKDTLLLFFPP